MYLHLKTVRACLGASLSRRYRDFRHLRWVAMLAGAFFLLRGNVALFRGLDHLLFPAFRRTAIDTPVYIIGNPRSGTTMLHRILARDPRFVTASLYESVFPSIVLHRLIRSIGRIDAALGAHLKSVVERLVRHSFAGWTGIHRTRFFEPEEDEQLFVYAAMSPVLALLFPFFDAIADVRYADRLPDKNRSRLMRHYMSSLRRLLYRRTNGSLLVKSTAITGRLAGTIEVLPDMRVVHIVRHPYEAIGSVLSMYRASWERIVPQMAHDVDAYRSLARLFVGYYRHRMKVLDGLPRSSVCEIRYEDLAANPRATIETVYRHFGWSVGDEMREVLRDASRSASSYHSSHDYDLSEFGIRRDEIYQSIPDVFERYGFDVKLDTQPPAPMRPSDRRTSA